MRYVGIVITIVSIIMLIIGITTTTSIHNYNRENRDNPRSDYLSILVGIGGAMFLIVGCALALQRVRKRRKK